MAAALHLVTPDDPAPKPEIAATHVTLRQEARQSFSRLANLTGQLGRTFSGPSCTVSAAAEIGRLCDEIRAEALRVKGLAR